MSTLQVGAASRGGAAPAPRRPLAAAKPKKPGLFASATEKRFARGIAAYAAGTPAEALALFREASERDGDDRTSADDLMCGLVLLTVDENAGDAATYLERVVASDNPLPDKLISTYAPAAVRGRGVQRRPGRRSRHLGAGGRDARPRLRPARPDDEAIGLVQKLHDVDSGDSVVILQLCMYHAKERKWDEIVHVAAQVANTDDLTCSIVNAVPRR
jgi:hypothetical protein